MKVLHLLNSDDSGAGRAANRLHKGLQKIGLASQMLVQHKRSDDESVIGPQNKLWKSFAKFNLTFHLDKLPLRLYHHREAVPFSPQWIPDVIARRVTQLDPDMINLHWICHGYLQIETIPKLKKPLIWTLHDMWAFTGGCFYSGNCERYKASCGACPVLHSGRDYDLSRWNWQRKAKSWKNLDLTVVTPSAWLAKCAKESSLFKNRRIEIIANGIDTHVYISVDKKTARSILNLPQNKLLILFGAMNPFGDYRKGYHLLQPALQNLSKSGWGAKVEIAIFGASKPENSMDLGLKTNYLGYLNDDASMTLAYSAADVMVLPSIQENLPQTGVEAFACGTPCVAFDAGGVSDIIDHQKNGYLARAYEVEDLAQGIIWVLEDEQRRRNL